MFDPWNLFLSMIFGSIGVGYFIYGKKQQRLVPLIVGVILMVYPYFVSNRLVMIFAGMVISAVPYFIRN